MERIAIMALQLALSQLKDENGDAYYGGSIDGAAGPLTKAALARLAKDWGLIPEAEPVKPDVSDSDTAEIPENAVLVFSLREHGNLYLSEHLQVKEMACNDGSDVVLVHPKLPDLFEEARKMVGPFDPHRDGSAYRTVSYNKSIKGSAEFSKHCWGIAMDIPKGKSTPEALYEHFDKRIGDQGGVGIYDWGIHVDFRGEKARWDSRTKK